MSKEAMKRLTRDDTEHGVEYYRADEVDALLAEQPAQQQEPVGFMNAGHVYELQQGRLHYGYVYPKEGTGANVAVYTAPQAQPAQRKPLTDEEIIASNYPDGEENGPTIAAPDFELICFARQIEAKLKEKNNG